MLDTRHLYRREEPETDEFCTMDGSIDWPKLVAFNSEKGHCRG